MISIHSNGQDENSFYVEIPNINNVPVVTHDKNGRRKAYSKTSNSTLNKLINSYKIYGCKKVFIGSKKPSLQNIYLIECNDLKLKDELFLKFKKLYPRVESAYRETFNYPNDYGSTGGYTGTDQDELDYIRAPEAWDITTGSGNIIIGVVDNYFQPNHEDLINTLDVISSNNQPNSSFSNQHGSRVASVAAAETNNGLGMSAIGYDSYIYGGVGRTSVMTELSLLSGVKVLNASWGWDISPQNLPNITSQVYDEIINDRKIVVIAAAGNGQNSGAGDPDDYYIPASYKDVISVSTIGHKNKTWTFSDGIRESFTDSHEYLFNNTAMHSHQHNDSIDIVAPGYAITSVNPSNGVGLNSYHNRVQGTSYSAPIVAGTVALMFDTNYCLDPREIETILKLTAVKIDTLPQNIQYYGKLGAGKLDAYEAVKMAKDMAEPFGTVNVKNRILYRWFYKLETAPYEIKMSNNDVTGNARLKFKARNNIEILSGDYYPSSGGYLDLSIDNTLALNCPTTPTDNYRGSSKKLINNNDTKNNILGREIGFSVFPNPTNDSLNIINNEDLSEISLIDVTGKIVYFIKELNAKELHVKMSNHNSGIYFVKVKTKSGEVKITKIIKD